MNIIGLYISILKIKRAFQIVNIIVSYTLTDFFHNSYIFHKGKKRSDKTQRKIYATPQRIRETIEALGPTFVKFGQILADRPDMVSDKFRVELKKLQSKVETFDNNLAITLIEKELGQTISEVFSEFEEEPLAAASIGQVYRARLKDGSRVVIKIQRPFIENKIKLDVYLMKYLAKKLVLNYPELAAINVMGLVDEFSDNIIKELDYTNEVSNISIFMRMFDGDPTIKIPIVYPKYCSKKLLVTEYIDGVTPENKEKLIEAGLDNKIVAHNGAVAIFKMILKFGIFHADPHPGNIFVLKDNVVAFIDFGMVGMLKPRDMNFLADFSIGFSKKSSIIITDALLKLCERPFFEQREELEFSIKQVLLQNATSKEVNMQNFSKIMQSSIDVIIKYNIQIPSSIYMLIKAMATLEKFAQNVDPELELAPIILPYSYDMVVEKFTPRKLAYEIYDISKNYINLIRNFPNDMGEILYKLKEGKIKHDIKVEDAELLTRTIRQMSLRIGYVILLIGMFIGSTILIVWDEDKKFGHFILYFSSVLILLLLMKWSIKRKA